MTDDSESTGKLSFASRILVAVVVLVAVAIGIGTYSPRPCEVLPNQGGEIDVTPTAEFDTQYSAGTDEFTMTVQSVKHTDCNEFSTANTGRLEVWVENESSTDRTAHQIELPFTEGDSYTVPVTDGAVVRVIWWGQQNQSNPIAVFGI